LPTLLNSFASGWTYGKPLSASSTAAATGTKRCALILHPNDSQQSVMAASSDPRPAAANTYGPERPSGPPTFPNTARCEVGPAVRKGLTPASASLPRTGPSSPPAGVLPSHIYWDLFFLWIVWRLPLHEPAAGQRCSRRVPSAPARSEPPSPALTSSESSSPPAESPSVPIQSLSVSKTLMDGRF